jgi:hypothetical protein
MQSVLKTADQRESEALLLRLADHPRIKARKAEVRDELAALPPNGTPEGATRLDRALELWTNSLILRFAVGDPLRPKLALAIDPTPRSWFGHDYPGAAWAGENPDFVYRIGFVDGRSRYEIIGRRQENPCVQYNFCTKLQTPGQIFTEAAPGAGDIPQFDMLQDSAIETDNNGAFRITLDTEPANGRSNHLRIPPESGILLIRDCLSDWKQSANALEIRRLDGPEAGPPPSEDDIAEGVVQNLSFWANYWARFAVNFMNHPTPNTLIGPYERDKGWGYAASGAWELADDEALVITADPANARYQGMMIIDPWMITPNAEASPISRNKAQTVPDADGKQTFIVSAQEPGYANWIATDGLRHGWMMMRLHLVDEGRIPVITRIERVKRASLDLPGVAKRGPAERAEELAQRRRDFASRFDGG